MGHMCRPERDVARTQNRISRIWTARRPSCLQGRTLEQDESTTTKSDTHDDDSSREIPTSEASGCSNATLADVDANNDLTQSQMEQVANMQNSLETWVTNVVQKGVKGLKEEYERLRGSEVQVEDECCEFVKNAKSGRNRYANVYCLDRTRVRLTNRSEGNDYIHANYIATPSRNQRFICTQAPTDLTISDFWHMVFQERAEYIVMLTNFIENGVVKCAFYLPLTKGAMKQFGDITVRCLECTLVDDFDCSLMCRKLSVTIGDAYPLILEHYQWCDWPDHGVPKSDSSVLQLLDIVRTSEKPIIVHCSAGIGRSGVLIVTEYVLEALICNQNCIDMSILLAHLRKQRAGLVQTAKQYLFIHRMLLLFFIATGSVKPNEAINEFISDYESFVQSKKSSKNGVILNDV